MSGLAMVTEAQVSMFTRHVIPWIHSLAIRLSWIPLHTILSVNREVKVGDVGGPLLSPGYNRFPLPGLPLHVAPPAVYSWATEPLCQHTGRPYRWRSDGSLTLAGNMAKSPSLVGGPAAALAASSFKDSFKASFRVRYPHIERCCFISRSRTLWWKCWGLWLKATGSIRSRGARCSTAALNCGNVSPLPWS